MPDADESGRAAIEHELADRLAGARELHAAGETLPRTLARGKVREQLFAEREAPVRVGRYVLLEVVGRGAMGVVFAAYDPQLERKIALKVMRSSGVDREEGRQRLLREAQALAKLAHPNVVAIHDVGVLDDDAIGELAPHPDDDWVAPGSAPRSGVFITMELVDGSTLSAWLGQEHRSWREIVGVLVDAGRGLAAAHDVGLVHRDFKPDNVMIGRDGRVRVMDFGLARAFESELLGTASGEHTTTTTSEVSVTASGLIAGTPLYMAPEQHTGVGVDAKSDQFGFCVTAWQSLFGKPPFTGDSLPALVASKLDGRLGAPPPRSGVPSHFETVLRRGLAASPADRFADMHRLLAALARDPVRARNRWIAGLGVLVAAGAATGGVAWHRAALARACERDAGAIAQLWNEEVRAEIGAAFAASELSFAESSRERIEPVVDDHVQRWSAVRASSCRAATLDGTRTPMLAARADECLQARWDELAGLLEVLRAADSFAITGAIEATAALADPEPCDDDDWLSRRADPSDDLELRETIAHARRELARARALERTGRTDEGLTLANLLLADLDRAGLERVRAEALLVHASLAEAAGDASAVLADHEAAMEVAFALGDDALLVEVLPGVIEAATRANRLERAQTWAELAPAVLSRVEPTPGLATANVHSASAQLALARGRADEGVDEATRALELRRERMPAGHPAIARAQLELALSVGNQGDHRRSAELLEETERLFVDAFGPEHPNVGVVAIARGNASSNLGDYREAIAQLERGLAISEASRGPYHGSVARALGSLCRVYVNLDELATAEPTCVRALEVAEQAFRADQIDLAQVLVAVAKLELARGRPGRARDVGKRALEVIEHAGGHEGMLGSVLDELGVASYELGDLEAAQAYHQRALALRERASHAGSGDYTRSLSDLAIVAGARGDWGQALELSGRALASLESWAPTHADVATLLYNYGDVAAASGRFELALVSFHRALALIEAIDPRDVVERAQYMEAIGRVQLELHEPARAAEIFRRGLALVRSLGPTHPLVSALEDGLAAAERAAKPPRGR